MVMGGVEWFWVVLRGTGKCWVVIESVEMFGSIGWC